MHINPSLSGRGAPFEMQAVSLEQSVLRANTTGVVAINPHPWSDLPEELHLSANALVELSLCHGPLELLGGLELLSSLQVLTLDSNQLSYLPASVGMLYQLRVLSLCYNQLDSLPIALAQCSQLQILRCSHNQLYMLPSLPTSLEVIEVDHNQLRSLSSNWWQLEALQQWNLSDNQLSFLPCPPLTLRSDLLPSLSHLLLSHNNLQEWPMEWASSLPSLQVLDIRHNGLNDLPEALWKRDRMAGGGVELRREGNPWISPPFLSSPTPQRLPTSEGLQSVQRSPSPPSRLYPPSLPLSSRQEEPPLPSHSPYSFFQFDQAQRPMATSVTPLSSSALAPSPPHHFLAPPSRGRSPLTTPLTTTTSPPLLPPQPLATASASVSVSPLRVRERERKSSPSPLEAAQSGLLGELSRSMHGRENRENRENSPSLVHRTPPAGTHPRLPREDRLQLLRARYPPLPPSPTVTTPPGKTSTPTPSPTPSPPPPPILPLTLWDRFHSQPPTLYLSTLWDEANSARKERMHVLVAMRRELDANVAMQWNMITGSAEDEAEKEEEAY